MRGASLGLAVVAVFLATVAAAQEEDALDRVPAAIVNPAVGKADSSLSERDRFLFGSYSTTTYTVVSATTSTVFYSCLSGTQTARCQGRRKRKDLGLLRETPLGEEEDKMELEGSMDDEAAASDTKELVPTNSDGKFAFTVWTTSRTTTSVTVIYTNTSTTIRISYYCIVGQIDLPAFPC